MRDLIDIIFSRWVECVIHLLQRLTLVNPSACFDITLASRGSVEVSSTYIFGPGPLTLHIINILSIKFAYSSCYRKMESSISAAMCTAAYSMFRTRKSKWEFDYHVLV
ncbi:hypothetical protein KP509_28G005800 [Ceratopteris richardii]|uniref:Uncharacterized protein n=1 Tax=Ceratopteris richardii TaxID=49495 RepID=A0A8T2R9C2_CERRI|nr:hypothetical protein KP509_28G005800 [Ceratopteris richardii]